MAGTPWTVSLGFLSWQYGRLKISNEDWLDIQEGSLE
jgi:hypothetical protein